MIIKNHILNSGNFKLDGGAMFGIIPKPLWEKKCPPDKANRIDLALRLWVIETTDKLIITDTGIGDYHGEKFNQQFDIRIQEKPLEGLLKRIGKTPDEVTDLVISHLHFDHVGGILKIEGNERLPVFENATLHIHQKHYEYSLSPTDRDSGSFHSNEYEQIIEYYKKRNQIHFVNQEEGELISEIGLKFKCSFGHTPWLMHPYNDQYIYLADLIPTSAHIHIPWVMGYDINPGITTEYKKVFLDFCQKENLKIIFEHDPFYWGCSIGKNQNGQYIAQELYSES
ncbi:MAG: MBL fold metallo-hydrolase [Halobacteriovoraceae bacterium]|nr:MBL fold metallo-hydrolase [Halobacteriovoraceae bacterium]